MTVDIVETARPPLDPTASPSPPDDAIGADIGVWRLSWRISQHRPWEFWVGSALFIVFFTSPALTGYALSRGYEALANGDRAATYWWAGAVGASEFVRMLSVHHGALIWTRAWLHMQTLLRANMLAAQMASGGPEAGQPVGSAGGAITHFRDDTEDAANFVDIVLDTTGATIFTIVAGFVLGAADPGAAAILVLPLLAVAAATRTLDRRIKEYRAADRVASADVSALLGDAMAAATTVKVNAATEPLVSRLRTLVERRRVTAVRDRVLDEGVQAFSQGAADVGLGLVLLVSAGAIASGAFDVGRLALFVAYLGWLGFLPRMIGRLLARRKQSAVAYDRMRSLVADRAVEHTVRPRDLPIDPREERVRPVTRRAVRVPLDRLDVNDLSAGYAGGAAVVGPVSFTVWRGEFVVVTGEVGSGKSTLLRALLGLAWQAEVTGSVRWNGVEVADRAEFFVPPNAAFLPQVPQLISDSVADNVTLGPVDPGAVTTALALAELTAEVDSMRDGLDTLIGPRGLRLSGGQRQRLATARALVHQPELVVLDDLSSALDVETELRLWENLAATDTTVIAVSHRAVALTRADRVIDLGG